jgi:hypothetical protein
MKREEHWVLACKAKANELRNIAADLIVAIAGADHPNRENNIKSVHNRLLEKTKTFFELYGPGQIPPTLTEFHHALEAWKQNRGNAGQFAQLMRVYEKLKDVPDYDEAVTPFHVLLEEFRNDAELEKALTDLVVKLRELLEVADIDLSAQIARELRRLLEELENRGKKTLTDLIAWIDLGMKGLADLLGKKGGFEHGSLVYECLKLALASKIRIMAVYEKAESEFRLRLGFSFLNKAARHVPDIRNEEDLKRYLPPPDQAANYSP